MRIAVIGLRGIPDVIGGIETWCEHLYPAILEADSTLAVDLFVRRGYVVPTVKYYKGIRLHSVWVLPVPGLETLLHTLFSLLYVRMRLPGAIVHLHGIGPAFWVPLARLLRLRTIVTHHAPDYERPKWSVSGKIFLKLGEAMASRFATHVICVSESVRTTFLDRYPAAAPRTTLIPNALRPLPEDTAIAEKVLSEIGLKPQGYFIAVGRLEETKHFQDLITAHARLGEDAPPLVIVGAAIDGDDYGRLLMKSTSRRIRFTGFRNGAELAALYRNAALFIHPSAMEGFGLVILEAMQLNVPIALSDIPPHREFGLPDAAYFKVGDIDAIAMLFGAADHCCLTISDRQEILSRYQLDNAAEAHLALYRSIS